MVEEQYHREGELIGIPVAGDDAEAVTITERLVRAAGFRCATDQNQIFRIDMPDPTRPIIPPST